MHILSQILPKPSSLVLNAQIQSCVHIYAALFLDLGLTEIKNVEIKRTKHKEDKSSYIRKSIGLLQKKQISSGRQKGR